MFQHPITHKAFSDDRLKLFLQTFVYLGKICTFAPTISPDGGIGRRAGLKHQWGNPSRFEPGSGYYKILVNRWFTRIFTFSICTKSVLVTILWEKCTFIVFQYSVLCLINDNSPFLFCFIPFLIFFFDKCPTFASSTQLRNCKNGEWSSKDTAWQYSKNIKLLCYSDL